MSIQQDSHPPSGGPVQGQDPRGHGGHHRHGWMMIACCIPMLAIAVTLVAAGVAGPGFLVVAIVCTLMMAMMMGAMGHSGDHRG